MAKWIKSEYHERLVMRCMVMGGQLGNVLSAIKHLVRNTGEMAHAGDKTMKGQQAYAMTELSDLIVQAELMVAELGYDVETTRKLGWDRYNERKAEFKSANKGHAWI